VSEAPSNLRTLVAPLVSENPITLQVLGVCSALAVTRTLATALVMCASVTVVLVCANAAISAIRREVPRSVRLIIHITIIASLVIVVDQFLQAFYWEISRQLSVFVGLIVTNCIILGRAETFAMHRPVRASIIDGLGNGLGYSLVLLCVAGTRELLGEGRLLGYEVFRLLENGGWFEPISVMSSPPSAFFLIGMLIWAIRSARTEQAEPAEAGTATNAMPRERS
jgi:Na+-transporting NADH:ubiquinone oxidoreductase subunit D